MDLHLTFADGLLTGDGTDDLGRFLIQGRYDITNRECWWTKTYPGSHDVIYRGFRENRGIWGTWEIPPLSKGGFHIWPRHAGNGEMASREAGIENKVEVFVSEAAGMELDPAPGAGHSFS